MREIKKVSFVGKIDLEFEVKGKKMKLSFGNDVKGNKIREIVESLQGIDVGSSVQVLDTKPISKKNPQSKMGKLVKLLEKLSNIGWFTSEHVRELYLHEHGEELKSSTISTYLARLCEEGLCEKQGSVRKREYRVIKIEKQIKTTA